MMEDNIQQPEEQSKQPIDSNEATLDLGDILSQPTIRREEVPLGQDDSEQDTPPEDIEGVASFDRSKVESIAADGIAETVAVSYDSVKLADTIIDFADAAIKGGMPYVYQALLSKEDRRGLKELAIAYRKAKENREKLIVSKDEERFLELQIDLDNYEQLLPLTPPEKESLSKPLGEVLKHANFKATPENALMLAAAMVAIPRTIPLLPLIFKKKEQ